MHPTAKPAQSLSKTFVSSAPVIMRLGLSGWACAGAAGIVRALCGGVLPSVHNARPIPATGSRLGKKPTVRPGSGVSADPPWGCPPSESRVQDLALGRRSGGLGGRRFRVTHRHRFRRRSNAAQLCARPSGNGIDCYRTGRVAGNVEVRTGSADSPPDAARLGPSDSFVSPELGGILAVGCSETERCFHYRHSTRVNASRLQCLDGI